MEKQTAIREICPTTTQEWLANGALLVDVREDAELEIQAYDTPNLVHIPLSDFEMRFKELPTDQKLVMACRSGARSLRAANFLLNNGYTEVVNMQGGIIQWAEKGYPTKGVLKSGTDCCSQPGCC
jgi:rhodanese-related sulfurtransferase